MEIDKIIDELNVFIAFYAEQSGAVPVCMTEAVKVLKAVKCGTQDAHINKAEIEYAIKRKADELRAVLQDTGGDYMTLHVSAGSAHVTVYDDFYAADDDVARVLLSGAWYGASDVDGVYDADWIDISDADGWVIEWEEA